MKVLHKYKTFYDQMDFAEDEDDVREITDEMLEDPDVEIFVQDAIITGSAHARGRRVNLRIGENLKLKFPLGTNDSNQEEVWFFINSSFAPQIMRYINPKGDFHYKTSKDLDDDGEYYFAPIIPSVALVEKYLKEQSCSAKVIASKPPMVSSCLRKKLYAFPRRKK